MTSRVQVLSTGAFLPGEPVPFDEVETVLGELGQVSDRLKWFVERSRPMLRGLLGIESYYYALDRETGEPTETLSGMAAKAALQALDKAGVRPSEVDFLCYGSAQSDYMGCPPTGPLVQEHIGIQQCAEVSIHSNCTASYKALQTAFDALRSGRYRTALVASSQINSAFFRSSYLNQASLTEHQASLRYFLCDGAGAVLLRREDGDQRGPGLYLEDTFIESVGAGQPPHMFTGIRGHRPDFRSGWEEGAHHLTQDFSEVSRLAPEIFRDGLQRMLDVFESELVSARFFLANIPNRRFMDRCAQECEEIHGLPSARVFSTLAERGYSGPPAVLISLNDLLDRYELDPGDRVMSFVTESSKWINAGFMLEQR